MNCIANVSEIKVFEYNQENVLKVRNVKVVNAEKWPQSNIIFCM